LNPNLVFEATAAKPTMRAKRPRIPIPELLGGHGPVPAYSMRMNQRQLSGADFDPLKVVFVGVNCQ
jgi:hypothetical protein